MTDLWPDRTDPASVLCGPTIPELLANAACLRGGDTYVRTDAGALSLGGLADKVAATQQALAGLGVRPGRRVAVMLPNSVDHAALILALVCMRAVWVPVNPRLRGAPLTHQLASAVPDLVIVGLREAGHVDAAGFGALMWTFPPAHRANAPGVGQPVVQAGPDDVVSVMYTSGTTGPAKGVQVTDRMLRASACGADAAADARDGDVLFLWEPLCHIGGAQVLLLPLLRRVSLAIVERFSASRFWAQVTSTDATHLHHLGGILPVLLSRPEHEYDPAHRVRVSWGGGMTADVWRAAEARFGFAVRECYGMTEASSIATLNARGPDHGIGRALPYFDVEVRDLEDTVVVPDGDIGEIALRPRTPGLVTPGYLGDPAATGAAWRDGWWHTGDTGRVVGGDLHYVGRRSDSVRHRGENVSAWEVESAVNSHPAVAESALVGVPATDGEQDLFLFVSLTDASGFEPGELVRWCRDRLAAYQVPRYVATVQRFTKTASQRIVKGALVPRANDCYDAGA